MLVAAMVVLVIGALCILVKGHANMINRRKKRIMRAAERKKSLRKKKMEEALIQMEIKNEDKQKPKDSAVKAISKSNPQTHRLPKPKSKKDFIIDIIDSALDGDVGDDVEFVSTESIDRVSGEQRRSRRSSAESLTLSLVFDSETDKPVFRRM